MLPPAFLQGQNPAPFLSLNMSSESAFSESHLDGIQASSFSPALMSPLQPNTNTPPPVVISATNLPEVRLRAPMVAREGGVTGGGAMGGRQRSQHQVVAPPLLVEGSSGNVVVSDDMYAETSPSCNKVMK